MKNLLLIVLLALLAKPAQAQPAKDSLFVQVYGSKLQLIHPVKKGERLSQIAQSYAVSPEMLAATNSIAFAPALTEGLELRIPLGKDNLTDTFTTEARPVFLRCEGRENFVVLASSIGLSFKDLQLLNPGLKQYCTDGALVLMGYLRKNTVRQDEIIPERDLTPIDTLDFLFRPEPAAEMPKETAPLNTAETSFQLLLDSGVPLTEQSGPVVFFPGGAGEVYYAFHSTASHGTILRIRNPANGRAVYAKVIGKLPGAKQYYKAAAAVSDNARRALGSLGDARMWCEIAYAGY